MAFTDIQTKALKEKLSHRHVKIRDSHGQEIAYVEGWHVIAEANRIFGFDGWDRQTLAPQNIWTDHQRGQTVCFYSTKVRVTVRAGSTSTVREGIGIGFGRSAIPEAAHELAIKASETDATKRALATFGNPFGLALYDQDQKGVLRPRAPKTAPSKPTLKPLVLRTAPGRDATYEDPTAFTAAFLNEVRRQTSVDALYAFWTANLQALIELKSRTERADPDPICVLIEALKSRARTVGLAEKPGSATPQVPSKTETAIASTPLLLPKDQRIRDRAHLHFVASHSCIVCGRRPTQAHHLRFAQPRAMAMKVSDEFTVPLCNAHHDSLHRTGDERAWWAQHSGIEPLKCAEHLWSQSRHRTSTREASTVDPERNPPRSQSSNGRDLDAP